MGIKKKPAAFLKNTNRIIFDMDGVITSEQNYWNAAALTVYEMLNSDQYFGSKKISTNLSQEQIKEIRRNVLVNDKIISLLKNKGVNSNWDLAFLVLCGGLIQLRVTNEILIQDSLSSDNFSLPIIYYEYIYKYFLGNDVQGFELYSLVKKELSEITGKDEEYFNRNGELWNVCKDVFQEWYLGDKTYMQRYGSKPNQSGKLGLMYFEQPIIPLDKLKEILKVLSTNGISLGIGTGRVYMEIHTPLVSWNIEKYFNKDSYISYTDVINAEEVLENMLNGEHLTKPHPYMFLKAIYGKSYPDEWLLKGKYDKSLVDNTLIVGDAGSDIMAAKAINCKFAAVLTGVDGEKAAEYFNKMGANYILNSIRDFVEC